MQGGQSIPSRKDEDLHGEWEEDMEIEDETESRIEDETESRKKVDEQKKCRRSYEMSTDCHISPKKCRRVSKSPWNTSCKRVEKMRHDLMHEHQKAQKKSQKNTASSTKEGTCRKKMRQHQKRCGRSERTSIEMRSVFGSC